jgi:uncharacterized repeat protein (TIGR01451 family)
MKMDKLFLRWIMAFGTLMMFAISGFGDVANNDTCPNIESVGNWTPVVSGTNTTLNGTLCESGGGVTCTLVDQYDYYSFTPGHEGTLDFTYGANQSSSLFITKTQCSDLTSNTYRVLNSGTSAAPTLSVSSTDTVYVRVVRGTNNALTSYTLGLGFTPTPVPVISNAGTARSVVENSTAGTNVGTALTATNTPTGFSITGGTGASLFNISSSGQITVRSGAILNYETATSYTLNIIATNGGGNSAPVTVTINITNVAGPTITSSQTFSIVGGSANGTAVTPSTLAVTIPTPLPSGNTTTTYTISSGPFAISSTGVISVANTSALTVGSATYTVTATNAEGTDSKTITITVTPPPSAELAITKTVDNATPKIGDTVTYTITVQNNGTLSSQVTVTDSLPSGLDFLSANESIAGSAFVCSHTGNDVTCRSGSNTPFSLSSGSNISFAISARVNGTVTGPIDNTANVVSRNSVYDNDLTNNSSTATITVPNLKAVNDSFTINFNAVLNNNVLTNDFGTSLVVISNTQPANGTLSLASDGTFTYTPNSDFAGIDTFTYTVRNANGNTDTATVTITVNAGDYSTDKLRPFSLYRQDNIYGDMQVIGNSVKLVSGGTCAPLNTNNNNLNTVEADLDTDVNTFNSTSADLTLPKGVKSTDIVYAMLFWQGRVQNTSQIINGHSAKIKPFGSSSYTTINSINAKFNWYTQTYVEYQGEADVTDLIKNSISSVSSTTINSTGYSKPVWVADVYSSKNGNNANGYGAWSLVIVYKNSNDTFKSISMYDGFDRIMDVSGSNNKQAVLSGFLTPKSGIVNSKFLLFAGEGDISLDDSASLTGLSGNIVSMGSNVFQSVVDNDGINVTARNPACVNTIGVDIRTFSVGTNGSIPVIGNNQTTTTMTMNSGGDEYFPGMFAFSTELYMPKLCYDYSYKQDNHYLKADNNGTLGILPRLAGTISNSPIETAVYIRNKEADINVNAVSFFTDVNTTMFDYVSGSTGTTNVNGTSYDLKADSTGSCDYNSTSTSSVACNDGHNVRIGLGNGAVGYGQTTAGSLGSQEFVYAKFDLLPKINGLQDINESLGLQLNYYLQPDINAAPIVYNYTLGKDISLCPPAAGYEPTWGIFNVVDAAASTINNLPANNLRTQVSREPFNVDVAVYQKNAITGKYTDKPTSDLNTTVLVEIIDNDAFHDANASCDNPGSAVSEPIFVRIGNTSSNMTIPVPVQNSIYHNFAVKNAAFRVWYFDQNETLIDWTAGTLDSTRLNLTNISSLYKNTYHTKCTAVCSSATSTACFACIKANYARALCSRDNFSVRPESYDVRLFDVNQTADTVQKDSTKRDLSTLYQYTPEYSASTGRINLAAGYDYRYDMNATGHDANLTAVPGYTRFFNGANNDYNATMIWEPTSTKTGCNDTSGIALSFYVANGQMFNREQNQSQVGEYRLNVIDPAWTAVDWNSALTGHHTVTNGFELTKEDCLIGSTSTATVNGKIGCLTSSDHKGGGYTYKDHLLTLQPYKFIVPSTFRYGTVPYDLNSTWSYDGNLTNDVLSEANIVYYSKISNNADMNMSLQIDGSIAARGYNDGVLSNFVRDCYAKPVNLVLDHNRTVQTRTTYQSRFLDYNSTGGLIYDSGAVNVPSIGAATIQTVNDGNFSKDLNGALDSKVRLNFDRNASVVLNPMSVRFYDYSVNCPDCNRSADLSTSSAAGSVGMGFDVMHYYGRAKGRDSTYTTATAEAGGYARIYFEAYCSDEANAANGGVDCDLGTLTSVMAGESPGWYVNIDHNTTNEGISDSDNTLSTGNLKVGIGVVPPVGSVSIIPTEVGFERYGVNYNGGNGYPYSTTLHNYANGWLIYNTSNPDILYNTFDVEFRKKGAWIGEGKSGSATDNDAPMKTNRRIMW